MGKLNVGRGGKRPGAGRKQGQPNRRTSARAAAVKKAAKQIEAVIPDSFKGDAHAYLMVIYKDPVQDTAVRLDAARAAIAFENPRLAPRRTSLSFAAAKALKFP